MKETIDVKDQHDQIDIINMGWRDYSNIMISLDAMIKQLEKPLADLYLESRREVLLNDYKEMFEKLKSNTFSWRGQAESLDDNIIEATRKL